MMAMYLLLGITAFAGTMRDKGASDRFYILLIVCIALSLLLSTTFASRNLSGYDVHLEYNIFSQTVSNGFWNPQSQEVYGSVLSVSVLPAILKIVTGMDGILIFKFVFPVIFSLVPVMLYKIYRKMLAPHAAFLGAFLFMSYPSFYYELTALARQEIAELMLVALLWVSLSPILRGRMTGKTMIVFLTIGLITSHYSLAYVYLLTLVVSVLLARISRSVNAVCTLAILAFTALVVAAWYLLVSQGFALGNLVGLILAVANGVVKDFLSPGSRPFLILEALGITSVASGVLHLANRITQYLVLALTMLGLMALLFKKSKNNVERTILPLMIAGFMLLSMSVLLPFFTLGLNLSRVYHIALMFISPCFVYGAEGLGLSLQKLSFVAFRFKMNLPRRKVLAAALLVSYFLFTSGWVWAASMDIPTSQVLDKQRMADSANLQVKAAYYGEYTLAQDITAAQWLKLYGSNGRSICADFVSTYHVLNSYGGFPRQDPRLPRGCSFEDDYIYLSDLNGVQGVGISYLLGLGFDEWHLSSISPTLDSTNRIYSGDAIVYLYPQ